MGLNKDEQARERSDETRRIEAEKEKDRYRQQEEDKGETARVEAEKAGEKAKEEGER